MIEANNTILLSVEDLARGFGVSEGEINHLNNSHEIPAPVMVDGNPHWHYWEIDSWLNEGKPPRSTWEFFKMVYENDEEAS